MKKNVFLSLSLVLLTLANVFSQEKLITPSKDQPQGQKPTHFNAITNPIETNNKSLNNLFNLKTGTVVKLFGINNQSFEGKLKKTYVNAPGSTSILFEDVSDASITYVVSKVVLENGQTKYTGIAQSQKHSDCLILESKDGSLYWTKKKLSEVIED